MSRAPLLVIRSRGKVDSKFSRMFLLKREKTRLAQGDIAVLFLGAAGIIVISQGLLGCAGTALLVVGV